MEREDEDDESAPPGVPNDAEAGHSVSLVETVKTTLSSHPTGKDIARITGIVCDVLRNEKAEGDKAEICRLLLSCLLDTPLPGDAVARIVECLSCLVEGPEALAERSQDLLEFIKKERRPWIQIQLLELCFRCKMACDEFEFSSENVFDRAHEYLVATNKNAVDKVISLRFSEVTPGQGKQRGWLDFGFDTLLVCFTSQSGAEFISVSFADVRNIESDDHVLDIVFERDNEIGWKAAERIRFRLVDKLSVSIAQTINARLASLEPESLSLSKSSIAVFGKVFSLSPESEDVKQRSLQIDECSMMDNASAGTNRNNEETTSEKEVEQITPMSIATPSSESTIEAPKNTFSTECILLSQVLSMSLRVLTKHQTKRVCQFPKFLRHIIKNSKDEYHDETKHNPVNTKRTLSRVRDNFHINMRHYKQCETSLHYALVKIERDQHEMARQLSHIQAKFKDQLRTYNLAFENELHRLRGLLREAADLH